MLLRAGGKASRIGIVHNIMAYETLAPHAFSARWADSLMAQLCCHIASQS